MSDVQDRRGDEGTRKGSTKAAETTTSPAKGTSAKAVRRAALQRAAAKRAAAKRRRNLVLSVLAGVAVLAVIVAVFQAAGKPKPATTDARSSATPSGPASAEGEEPTPAPAANFPALPAGADPALGTKPVATAGTGELAKLTVTPVIEGKGAPVQAGQTVTVNYVGVSYRDGQEFDSSWKRSESFPFRVGAGDVIKGWDEGLVGVKVGSRVVLDIPPELAYGESGPVPGPLRFIVDVLDAK